MEIKHSHLTLLATALLGKWEPTTGAALWEEGLDYAERDGYGPLMLAKLAPISVDGTTLAVMYTCDGKRHIHVHTWTGDGDMTTYDFTVELEVFEC